MMGMIPTRRDARAFMRFVVDMNLMPTLRNSLNVGFLKILQLVRYLDLCNMA